MVLIIVGDNVGLSGVVGLGNHRHGELLIEGLSEVDVKNLRHVLSVVGEKLSDEEWRELQKELPVENGKVLHHSGDTEIAYLIIRRKTLN